MDHHGHRLVCIEIGHTALGRQAHEGLLCFFDSAFPDKPPRRLRGKVNANEQRHWPHPLQSIRDAVSPLVGSIQHIVDNNNTEELPQTPAEIDICGKVTTESDRADLGGVSNGDGLEHPPGNSAENFRGEQGLNVISCEEERDECGQPDEA